MSSDSGTGGLAKRLSRPRKKPCVASGRGGRSRRVLREIKNGALVRQRLTPLGWRWCFARGSAPAGPAGPAWSTRRVRAIEAAQRERPVALVREGRGCTWLFEDRFYQEDEGLTEHDVLALVRERERRARRTLERAHATLARAGAGTPGRERIPADVRRVVFERDGGRCVECGSDFDLQYDHVIPHSLGGASTAANLQVLCSGCNQRKGASHG
jgi:5-methylcytosine-specific restriction endonuclease McrA